MKREFHVPFKTAFIFYYIEIQSLNYTDKVFNFLGYVTITVTKNMLWFSPEAERLNLAVLNLLDSVLWHILQSIKYKT